MSSTYTKVTFNNRQPDTATAIKLNHLIDDLSTAIAAGGGGGGTGDMTKAVYDTNNNGKVDTCDSLPWGSVTGKPSTFTPSAHAPTHRDDGSDPIPVATTAHTGSLPILSGSATTFLNGTGVFSVPAGSGAINWRGTWSGSNAYAVNDLVSFSDSTHSLTDFVCTGAITAPTGSTYNYWSTTPSSAASISPNVYANEYSFASAGQINKIGLYKGSVEAAVTSHRIGVWIKATGVNILDVTSSGEPNAVGWYWYTLATPLAVNTTDHYVIGHALTSEVVRNPGVTFPITHGPITKVNAGFQSSWGMPPMGSSTSDLGNDVEYFVPSSPNPIPPSDPTHWAQVSLGPHAATHLDNGSDPIPVVTTSRTGLAPILSGVNTTYLDGTGSFTTPAGVPTTRTVTGVQSVAGGGDLSANRTLNLVNDVTTPVTGQAYMYRNGARGWFQPGYLNVLDYGADNTGVADCTTAITNALAAVTAANGVLFFPSGVYLLNSMITVTGKSFFCLLGTFGYGSIIKATTSSAGFTFSNCQQFRVEGIAFNGNNVGTTGILVNSGSGTSLFKECNIYLWMGSGLSFTGTSGTQMSGHRAENCFFLDNVKGGSSIGQLQLIYSQDFILNTNNVGVLSLSSFPPIGIELNNSGNGVLIDNEIWNQTVGLKATTALYNRIIGNRFEQSNHEAIIFSGCAETNFAHNWLNQNCQAAANTYDEVSVSGSSYMLIEGNILWDWGGASKPRYGFNFATSSFITLKGNRVRYYATAPYFFDASTVDNHVNQDLFVSLNARGTIPVNTSTYVGLGASSFTETDVMIPLTGDIAVIRMAVASAAAPGASQTYTYTLRKSGTNTATAFTTSGASSFGGSSNGASIQCVPGDYLSVLLVTSTTATATAHRLILAYAEY